ncbi:MAG: hypothetical protein BGP24_03940 [Lysobacterales bacterium 69-70]|nr:DUF423 domain-containing protein [Xanthomonadaceae bacterium]ODU32161.1 MAG: hypothetical protein ABS97_18200 [Xanthomonadaceae bacterium SCN 69-320]ODV19022.1 MAG: hypothetical protein ABT27_12350 [Xanthomonadaceae bacterium SCN 69-25]OJZ01884.1 MAG: hypothetical protein BGP24_03940 [Xanthomonadales bacterium 69-70]
MPHPRLLLLLAALGGALAVACGAFGAHALRASLDANQLALWQTAVSYLFWHVLAALFAARHAQTAAARGSAVAATLFLAGSAVFSLTLFGLALGAPRWFGAITPLGGTALIAGWLVLGWTLWRRR